MCVFVDRPIKGSRPAHIVFHGNTLSAPLDSSRAALPEGAVRFPVKGGARRVGQAMDVLAECGLLDAGPVPERVLAACRVLRALGVLRSNWGESI